MPTNVIMPALEMAQETGKVLRWIKSPGDRVIKGESIVEIETDKVTVEIEAPASGILRDGPAGGGDGVPAGRPSALTGGAGGPRAPLPPPPPAPPPPAPPASSAMRSAAVPAAAETNASAGAVKASPLAR